MNNNMFVAIMEPFVDKSKINGIQKLFRISTYSFKYQWKNLVFFGISWIIQKF